jgi:hypothetical protein
MKINIDYLLMINKKELKINTYCSLGLLPTFCCHPLQVFTEWLPNFY